MAKAKFNQEIKDTLDLLLLEIPGVNAGKMFGYPAYYVGNNFSMTMQSQLGISWNSVNNSHMGHFLRSIFLHITSSTTETQE